MRNRQQQFGMEQESIMHLNFVKKRSIYQLLFLSQFIRKKMRSSKYHNKIKIINLLFTRNQNSRSLLFLSGQPQTAQHPENMHIQINQQDTNFLWLHGIIILIMTNIIDLIAFCFSRNLTSRASRKIMNEGQRWTIQQLDKIQLI